MQPNFALTKKIELVGVFALVEDEPSRIKVHVPGAPGNELDMVWREVSEERMCS
ncbi:MAG TPA: hypothetical protein VFB10_11515 [Candidatus Dormibacteraeota bacterium]|nr:hypothetical protein [Candidatus Dormibacteraeota bacterium]